MTARGHRGKHNSSATRIRPFFQMLTERDATGESWLPELLSLFEPTLAISRELLSNSGPIREIVFETETQSEKALAPPYAFLRWLISNPGRMTWPKGKAGEFSAGTKSWRIDLMGLAPEDTRARQLAASERAFYELEHCGSGGSSKKWWAFEGFTKVDCFIATDRLKVYVEGKRTELLSPSTAWFPQRNQLVRNVEAAREDAGTVPFVCLVLRESPTNVPARDIDAGLPHMSPGEISKLMQHYVGDV